MAAQLGASTFRGTQLQIAQPFSRCAAPARLQVVAIKPIQGKVVSTSMQQTAVVQVDRFVPHPIYGKRVRKSKKFFAHDEDDACEVGDVVEMVSIPPKSKRKTFKIHRIVTKSVF